MSAARICVALLATGTAAAAGCSDAAKTLTPLGAVVVDLDTAVTVSVSSQQTFAGGPVPAGDSASVDTAAARIRQHLWHELPEARALAAEAAAAARDWESMPRLIELLDDADVVVRGRASVACAKLLGMDFGLDPRAVPAERAAKRAEITRAYAAMRANPPPQYRR